MTVLHLISGRGPTGAAAAAINDLRALRAAGVRACAGFRRDAPAIDEALEQAGIPTSDRFPKFRFQRGAVGMLTAFRDAAYLSKIVREQGVRTIHVHRTGEQWLAYLASQSGSPPPLLSSNAPAHRAPGHPDH